jgi:hypothetical protein
LQPQWRGLAVAIPELVGSLSRRHALDRLIRGRVWIALIAFALIGIVTLQLLVLQLNAGIGRALGRQVVLQRENATLSIEVSELAAGERVETQAARLGMELVPVSALRFLSADPRADIARAAAALNTPVHAAATGSAEASAAASSEASASAPAGGATQEQLAASSAGTATAGATAGAPSSSSGETTAGGETAGGTDTAETQQAPPSTAGSAPTATAPSTPAPGEAVGATGDSAPASSAGGVGANDSLGPG